MAHCSRVFNKIEKQSKFKASISKTDKRYPTPHMRGLEV
jgi:hypothetical protein